MTSSSAAPRFNRLARWLTRRVGQRVFKVSLRGGFDCPNRDGTRGRGGCTFCAGDALLPAGYRPEADLAAQLAAGAEYIAERHGARRFIAYFHDYTATYAPISRLRQLYHAALEHPGIVGLAVGTRPDCVAEPVLELLEAISARTAASWVELGLQLADDRQLERLNRGHTVAAFIDAVRRCQARGLRVCAHVIVGLPGACRAVEIKTIDLLAELDVWGVKLHAFHVLRGAALARAYAARPWPLLTRQQHAERVAELLERLPPQVVVHRVTAEAPRRETVAPRWTVNKMAAFDAVLEALARRDSWQGRLLGAPRPVS